MKKNETHSFMDNLNLFLVGTVVGCIIGACFMSNYHTGNSRTAEKKLEAYDRYYNSVETLLDSLDGTRGLDLMDTDLATDYGADYLNAKSVVDSLNNKQLWTETSLQLRLYQLYLAPVLLLQQCQVQQQQLLLVT